MKPNRSRTRKIAKRMPQTNPNNLEKDAIFATPQDVARYSRSEVDFDNGFNLNGTCFPLEVINRILSFVDKRTLIRSCCYVCHTWYEIMRDDVWKMKAEREFPHRLPKQLTRRLPSEIYQGIYLKDVYNRNLLRNPSGLNKMMYWNITSNGGDHWKAENPPTGVEIPLPQRASDHSSCFATSYSTCSKQQRIDLWKEGIKPEILDKYQPHIVVSEWYSARWDCGSTYQLYVELQDKNRKIMQPFEFNVKMENWVDGWKQIKESFHDYGTGLRYVMFRHTGCDTQFWAGHYGAKMTGASLYVDLATFHCVEEDPEDAAAGGDVEQ